jgi:hypothetical protein
MSDPVTITIKAAVDSNEQAAVSLAASLLEKSLSAAAGDPVAVRCQFEPSLGRLKASDESGVIISSLLPEVANYEESWTTVESRLREIYRRLAGTDGAALFLCTIFRHVPSGSSADHSRLVRVRRLNLLAAEISRETGACVIDIDRSLADIGASQLNTDYRLGGQYASEAAAKFIALAVLSAGLDNYVSFEIQDAARASVAGSKLNLSAPVIATRDIVLPNLLKLGPGRRKQVVATVVDTDQDDHAGWLIHLLMTRQFGVRDAIAKLRGSIARRGLRSSAAMILAAARQALRGRTSIGR